MFCPKCGTENPEANKFCRACRESLLVVAQAMKKRLPVMIVSQLDAALERLSERFRRDSILFLIFGIVMTISTALHFGNSSKSIFGPLLALMGWFASGWSYLLYRRSLTLGQQFEAGQFFAGAATNSTARASGIQSLDLAMAVPEAAVGATSTREMPVIFCPTCGAQAEQAIKHCRSCGADLRALRKAMEPSRWRLQLNSLLDGDIKRSSDKSQIRRSARLMLFAGLVSLPAGIHNLYNDQDPLQFLLAMVFLSIGLWDNAAARRWFPAEEEEKRSDTPPTTVTDRLSVPTTNKLAPPSDPSPVPLSVTEETTRRLEPVPVEPAPSEVEIRKL